jgi:dipeptidyl aminopeptidase/acylaminoacyl peptidase
MDSNGQNQTLLTPGGIGTGDNGPTWSPGGTMIAFSRDMTASVESSVEDIYVMQADGTGVRRLTSTSTDDYAPSWSPDGARLAFASNRAGNYEIYSMAIDGSDVRRLTNTSGYSEGEPSWSPDGKRIAFWSNRAGNAEIYTMNVDGSGVTRLTNNAAADYSPTWAPDGSRIAFGSDRSGDSDIHVMNADGSSVVNLTNDPSSDDGWPSWSPDGTMITFGGDPAGDYDLFAVNASGGVPVALAYGYDDEWNPDWQPLPAFPLVDARFSMFKSDIEWVYDAGITSGCSAERYCPEGYVTREQMASFLARALHLSGSAPDAFTDDESSIHEPNINLVAREGIASGCGNNKYCPTLNVTRGQMAAFLHRAFAP